MKSKWKMTQSSYRRVYNRNCRRDAKGRDGIRISRTVGYSSWTCAYLGVPDIYIFNYLSAYDLQLNKNSEFFCFPKPLF